MQQVHRMRSGRFEHGLSNQRVSEIDRTTYGLEHSRIGRGGHCIDNRRKRLLCDRGEKVTFEVAEDRTGAHYVALRARQPFEAGVNHVAYGARHQRGAAPPVNSTLADLHRPGPEMGVEDLLHQQRNAIRARHDIVDELSRRLGVEQRAEELGDLTPSERLEIEHVGDAVTLEGAHDLLGKRRFSRAQRADDIEMLDRGGREIPNRFEAVGICRVQIVEDDHRASTRRRDPLHEANNAFEREQPKLRV
jgi:hypothetical protein